MIALAVVIAGFLMAYFCARRSLALGCLAVLAVGYSYGILRANLLSVYSHFIFDAALIGFYLPTLFRARPIDAASPSSLKRWVSILIGWPVLLVLLPFQTFLISLVGLRGNIFMLPTLLIGSRLTGRDLVILATGLAGLNITASAFGIAEYFLGIEPFYPLSPTTMIIYASLDAAGEHRLPATFANAHAYAFTMVSTLPFLFGFWAQPGRSRWRQFLILLGIVAALVGAVLASTRLGIIVAAMLVALALLRGSFKIGRLLIWAVCLMGIVYMLATNERFQRYKTLGDTDVVTDRIAGSVNRTFFEILVQYPMGNGLGGGGTSIPYFLESQVHRPVLVENEYSRILLEQGVIGLLIWIGFIVWFLLHRTADLQDPWLSGRRLAWWACTISLTIATIGWGLLTGIPNTFIFLLSIGWVSSKTSTSVQHSSGGVRRRVRHSDKDFRWAIPIK